MKSRECGIVLGTYSVLKNGHVCHYLWIRVGRWVTVIISRQPSSPLVAVSSTYFKSTFRHPHHVNFKTFSSVCQTEYWRLFWWTLALPCLQVHDLQILPPARLYFLYLILKLLQGPATQIRVSVTVMMDKDSSVQKQRLQRVKTALPGFAGNAWF